jgi:hypothetical protein
VELGLNKLEESPPDLPRLIQDVLAELGYEGDAVEVAKRVRRLDIGLPAEDEFSVVCAWLGKCELLHKLDQCQVPVGSKKYFQVPDLLAQFSTQTSKSPVLIEVKSKSDKVLSFKPEYLNGLQNYADLMGMPLLVAWKFNNIWTLFDVRHMKKASRKGGKNFKINIFDAMKENLLGILAGDVAYTIGAGAGVHFRLRKDELLRTEISDNDCTTEEWKLVIEDVSFTDYMGGTLGKELSADIQSLFATWNLEIEEVHTDSYVYLDLVAKGWKMQYAHAALVELLNWEPRRDGRPQWRRLLKKEKITESVTDFTAALYTAHSQKVVYNILHQLPSTMPGFLPSKEEIFNSFTP